MAMNFAREPPLKVVGHETPPKCPKESRPLHLTPRVQRVPWLPGLAPAAADVQGLRDFGHRDLRLQVRGGHRLGTAAFRGILLAPNAINRGQGQGPKKFVTREPRIIRTAHKDTDWAKEIPSAKGDQVEPHVFLCSTSTRLGLFRLMALDTFFSAIPKRPLLVYV